MRRIRRFSLAIAALSCMCICMPSCTDNDSDSNGNAGNNNQSTDPCVIFTPQEIEDLGLDCGSSKPCDIGTKKCNGLDLMECKAKGNSSDWEKLETCTTSCVNNACTAPAQGCDIGTKKCSGNDLMECKAKGDSSDWEKLETCTTSCENNACTAPVLGCDIGTRKCSGNDLMECQVSGSSSEWKKLDTCTYACEIDECTDPAQSCNIGAKKCSGKDLMECKASGDSSEWQKLETCPYTCENNACKSSSQPVCDVGKIACSGVNRRECIDDNGTIKWKLLETCPRTCKDGECSDECLAPCTPDKYSCSGKILSKCEMLDNGCYGWKTAKTCERFCYADIGKCAEELPQCELTNNSKAALIEWVDGDTAWVRPIGDSKCNEYEYDSEKQSWVRIRFNIRIQGIDAPECTKEFNGRYQTCTQDTNYTNDNEIYGYEAWQAAVSLVPAETSIILTCDDPEPDGTCPVDATGHRDLAYVGYAKGNASYDFSTELTRLGMAFSNTEFPSSKRKDICLAQKEAQDAKVGIWSTGGLSQMGASKRRNLSTMEARCKAAIQGN